ncbi:MAG: hypothetical protein H0V42_10075 [Nocardioidaceae bacterium]|nr:hypothetical protein [Nocardioidaceae bacterium]
MSNSSVLYTIGTALNRVHDRDVPVQVLVEGQWMAGTVVAIDGHGVVLTGDDLEHAVIRMQSISAVRIFAPAPQHRVPVTAGVHEMAAAASF